MIGRQTAPLKPVVVGQDPEKRGVDLEMSVRIPPVIFTWYEARPRQICQYAANGNGKGCPGPGRRYEAVIDGSGEHIAWSASMETNPNWKRTSTIECIPHVEIYPDYLNNLVVSLNLSAESRSWILGDLAAAYPGAKLKHPDWQFALHGPGSQTAGGTVTWSELIPNIQTADPGTYAIHGSGSTTGTPVSGPRSFDQSLGQFVVELLRVSLIGAP